jgi:DNA repair exonuclease SbcCD ATPase subunit
LDLQLPDVKKKQYTLPKELGTIWLPDYEKKMADRIQAATQYAADLKELDTIATLAEGKKKALQTQKDNTLNTLSILVKEITTAIKEYPVKDIQLMNEALLEQENEKQKLGLKKKETEGSISDITQQISALEQKKGELNAKLATLAEDKRLEGKSLQDEITRLNGVFNIKTNKDLLTKLKSKQKAAKEQEDALQLRVQAAEEEQQRLDKRLQELQKTEADKAKEVKRVQGAVEAYTKDLYEEIPALNSLPDGAPPFIKIEKYDTLPNDPKSIYTVIQERVQAILKDEDVRPQTMVKKTAPRPPTDRDPLPRTVRASLRTDLLKQLMQSEAYAAAPPKKQRQWREQVMDYIETGELD